MNEWVVIAVLGALVGLRVAAVAFIVAFIVRPVTSCPACFRSTFPIRKGWLRLLRTHLEWRWCPTCGWEGLARRLPRARSAPSAPTAGRHAPEASGLQDGLGPGG
jgi:hypothetical protein